MEELGQVSLDEPKLVVSLNKRPDPLGELTDGAAIGKPVNRGHRTSND